jgi:uncharacterized membrane protein YjjP (DUF1212 family)
MSVTEKSAIAPRESLLTRFLHLKRGPWEGLATAVIAAGVVMLMQSWSITLYSWSFITILVGTALFVIVSHFKD